MIKEIPEEITLCRLEVDCVLMPNGEVISEGKTLGWFKDLKDRLSLKVEQDEN